MRIKILGATLMKVALFYIENMLFLACGSFIDLL